MNNNLSQHRGHFEVYFSVKTNLIYGGFCIVACGFRMPSRLIGPDPVQSPLFGVLSTVKLAYLSYATQETQTAVTNTGSL